MGPLPKISSASQAILFISNISLPNNRIIQPPMAILTLVVFSWPKATIWFRKFIPLST